MKKGSIDLGTSTNSRSFEIESWSYIQHRDYQLQVMTKIETKSSLPTIPASLTDVLSYFRIAASLPHKYNFLVPYLTNHFSYILYTIILTAFYIFPINFIYVFLASYAGDEHMYISKMVPIFYGHNYALLFSAILNLVAHGDMFMLYGHILEKSLLTTSPWYSCDRKNKSILFTCKTYPEITELQNKNSTVIFRGYIRIDGAKVLIPPIIMTDEILGNVSNACNFGNHYLIYFYLVWIIAALCYKSLFKIHIWKMLNISHWCLNIIQFLILIHIVYTKMEVDVPMMKRGKYEPLTIHIKSENIDKRLLTVSLAAPAIVHIVISRNRSTINPGRLSTLIVFSNVIYILIRTYLINSIRIYTEQMTDYPCVWTFGTVYTYPAYWNDFFFRDSSANVYFLLLFVTELATFIITFQCIIEHIVTEWPKIKRWIATLVVAVIGLLLGTVTNSLDHVMFFIYSTFFVNAVEAAVIVFLYPITRLKDDITFHTGSTISNYRLWSLRVMPFYYIINGLLVMDKLLYILNYHMYSYYKVAHNQTPAVNKAIADYMWFICCAPYILGMFYVIYKLLHVKKVGFKALFRPLNSWGPRDHVQKELRKQYDSREYIASQSSRFLSRYLTTMGQTQTYKLNICYERAGRRSTVIPDAFRLDNEKKIV